MCRIHNTAKDFLPQSTRSGHRAKKTKLEVHVTGGIILGTLQGSDGNGGINLKVYSSDDSSHQTGETISIAGTTPTRRITVFPELVPE